VHLLPPARDIRAFLFPSWESGVAGVEAVTKSGVSPSLMRLYDPDETQLSFHMKPRSSAFMGFVSEAIKQYVQRVKGFDIMAACLLVVAFEGKKDVVSFQRRSVSATLRHYGGFPLGPAPGRSWYEKRYDLPLLRDLLLDHGLWVDVAESAMTWSALIPLWRDVKQSLNNYFESQGIHCFVGAHISHTYPTGACVYFHFAAPQAESKENPALDMQCYTQAKKLATQAILRNGGALSHHHGVGYEHIPFMGHYLDWGSLLLLRSLKTCLDPKDICNPGKLLPAIGN